MTKEEGERDLNFFLIKKRMKLKKTERTSEKGGREKDTLEKY